MSQPKPTMRSVSVNEVRQELEELLRQVAAGEANVLVEDNGEPIAGIVSARELQILTQLGPEWWQRFEPLLRSWAAFSDDSPEQIEREIEQALSD